MRWITIAFFAFCFGLGYWEFATRMRLGKAPYGHYASGLPRVFASPIFQLLKLVGSGGFLIVPLVSWGQGFAWGAGAMFVFLIGGAAIGIAIPRLVERLAQL